MPKSTNPLIYKGNYGKIFGTVLVEGCKTIIRVERAEFIDGSKIIGSEEYILNDISIREEWVMDRVQYHVTGSGKMQYKVEKKRKTWEDVDYERLVSIVGIHPDYNVRDDVMESSRLLLTPLLIFSGIFEWKVWRNCQVEEQLLGGILFFVPGIHLNGASDGTITLVRSTECVQRNARIERIGEQTKSEMTNVEFRVVASNGCGKVLASEKIVSSGKLDIPVCDVILNNPDTSEIVLKIESDSARVEGQREFKFKYDVAELVERRLKARPNAHAYDPVNYVLGASKPESNRKDGRLEAGAEGMLAVELANLGIGDGYQVEINSECKIGDVLVSNPTNSIVLLRAGQRCLVNVPYSIPLRAPNGESEVRLVAKDALGRKSQELKISIPYARRDLPVLQITGMKVVPIDAINGEYALDVTIRNKGAGHAEQVRLAVEGTPNIGLISNNECMLGEINAFDQQTARLRIRFPGDVLGESLRVRFAALERFGVGNTVDELEEIVR